MPAEMPTSPAWQISPTILSASSTLADERRHRRGTPQLVRRPAAGDHDGVDVGRRDGGHVDVRGRLEPVLPAERLARLGARDRDRGPLLTEAHDGDPELEVLEAFGHEDHDALALEATVVMSSP